MYLPLIAAFIAISGSMGVSYMAEESLPGDALYPLKVHVNENVRHMTAVKPETKARVSAEIIARRAQEARRLVAEGRLDSEAKTNLSKEIQSELKTWNEATSDWASDGTSSSQTEARIMFESQAEANTDIFQLLGVSLDLASTAEASSSATGIQVSLPLLEENASSTTGESNSFDTANESASTSLDASGVIDVR